MKKYEHPEMFIASVLSEFVFFCEALTLNYFLSSANLLFDFYSKDEQQAELSIHFSLLPSWHLPVQS